MTEQIVAPVLSQQEVDLADDDWFAAWVERAEADEAAIREDLVRAQESLDRIAGLCAECGHASEYHGDDIDCAPSRMAS